MIFHINKHTVVKEGMLSLQDLRWQFIGSGACELFWENDCFYVFIITVYSAMRKKNTRDCNILNIGSLNSL